MTYAPGVPIALTNAMPTQIVEGSAVYKPGAPISMTNPLPVMVIAGTPTPGTPTLSLSSAVTLPEGNVGTTAFIWVLTLDRQGSLDSIPFTWNVAGYGASPANEADFPGGFPSGSGVFSPGQTAKAIVVNVTGDTAVEPDETFLLTVVSALNTVSSIGTISNDDTGNPNPTPTLKSLGAVGVNPSSDQLGLGTGFPFLDRSKLCTPWQAAGGSGNAAVVLTPLGYPTGIPAGRARVEHVMNVEGPYGPADKQHYVIETTKTDWFIGANDRVLNVVTQLVSGGTVRRTTFDVSPITFPPNIGYGVYVWVTGAGGSTSISSWVDGTDKWVCFRADEEAELKAGNQVRQQYIGRTKQFDPQRKMDWASINHSPITSWSQYPKMGAWRWTNPSGEVQVPMPVIMEAVNRENSNLWLPLPHGCDDDLVVQMTNYVMAKLASNLVWIPELSNEASGWNFGAGFDTQSNYFYNLFNPKIPGADNPGSTGYGWKSARVMALILKTSGYSTRIRPFFNTQLNNTVITEGVLVGIRYAIAQWSDPTNTTYYNAEYAAKFKQPSDLFAFFGAATYMDGNVGDGDLSNNDKNKLLAWAAATDGSGVTAFFNQLRTGLELTDVPVGRRRCLANWTNLYAGDFAISLREQIVMIAYEGDIGIESAFDPSIYTKVHIPAMKDDRMRVLQRDWIAACFNAGFQNVSVLCDVGARDEVGGPYGSLANGYDLTLPRHVGLSETAANPPALLPLTATVATTGNYIVGASPITHLTIRGGRAPYKVVATGLAPGRAFSKRDVTGVLSTIGKVTGRLTITDDQNLSTYVDFDQDVKAPGPKYDHIAIVVTRTANRAIGNNQAYFTQAFDWVFYDETGAVIPGSWTGDQQSGHAVTNLGDGDPATEWTASQPGDGGQYTPYRPIYFTFTSSSISGFGVRAYGNDAPGDFEVRGYVGAPPAPTSAGLITGGTVIRAVTGLGTGDWPLNGDGSKPYKYFDTVA